MSLASTSSAQLAYKEEAAYGVIPEGAPKRLRMTGEDLAFDFTSESSKEINDTRQSPDSVIVDASASGGFNIELSYREYDPFLEALLASTFSTWGTGGAKDLTVTFAKAAGTITDDGVDGFAGGIAVGQWFSVIGGANAGVYRCAARTDDVITVDASTPLAADGAAQAVAISSTRLTNGTAAMRSFCIEKSFKDVNQFFMHKGRVPSKLDLNFATGQMLTGTIGLLGATATRSGSTQFADAAGAAQSYGVMNAVTGVGSLLVRNTSGTGVLGNTYVKSMQISIDAKLREQKAISVLGAAGVGLGQFAMTGTLEVYLADGTIYDEALAGKLVSVTFPVYDALKNGYGFTFANCKLNVPKVVAGSMDADVMLSIPFTAVAPNTATDRMIALDRFGAAIA